MINGGIHKQHNWIYQQAFEFTGVSKSVQK